MGLVGLVDTRELDFGGGTIASAATSPFFTGKNGLD